MATIWLPVNATSLGLSQALTLGWPLVVSLALLLGAEAQIEVLLDPLPASSNASGSPSISARSEHQGFRNPITCTCNFAALKVEFDVLSGATT